MRRKIIYNDRVKCGLDCVASLLFSAGCRLRLLFLEVRGRDLSDFARQSDYLLFYSLSLFNLSAFTMTETELRLIAALAIIGLSRRVATG